MRRRAFYASLRSGKDQCARTPARLYREIRALAFPDQDQVVFDPCPPNPTFDGLEAEWGPCAYVNPPFSGAVSWVRRAVDLAAREGTLVAMLLPMRCSSGWFAELVAGATLLIWTRRVPFAGYKLPLPLPSVVALIPPRPPVQLTTPPPPSQICPEIFPVLGGQITVPPPATVDHAADCLRALHPGERVDTCLSAPSDHLAKVTLTAPCLTVTSAAALQTAAFRALCPHVTHLYFIAPRLRRSEQDANTLIAPSVAFRTSPFRPPLSTQISPRIFLARPGPPYSEADNAPADIV